MKEYYLIFPHGAIRVVDHYGIDVKELLASLPVFFDVSYTRLDKPVLLELIFMSNNNMDATSSGIQLLIHGGLQKVFAQYQSHGDNEYHYSFDDGEHIQWNKSDGRCFCYLCGTTNKYIRFFIKEFVFEHLYSLGYCTLHAAAFCNRNKAYIIVGNKGAGKTTLLLGLYMISKNIQIIANDRVLVRYDKGKYYVLSADTGIRVTEDTLDLINSSWEFEEKNCFNSHSPGGKLYSSLRNFNRSARKIIKLDGIILANAVDAQADYYMGKAPIDAIVQDKDEHPRWLNSDETRSLRSEACFLQGLFKCIPYVRGKDLKVDAQRIFDILDR